MPTPFTEWTVLPHREVAQIDENILSVSGEIHMPIADFERRMTVVRLADGRLVIYSAIALYEPEMRALEEFGIPAFLVVPSARHRLDAKIWKDRYPNIKVIAPQGARAQVADVVSVDATRMDFNDNGVSLETVAGTNANELALRVKTARGVVLIVNDLIGNLPHRKGLSGVILRIMGFTGPEPRIPKLIKQRLIHDKREVQRQLQSWAQLPLVKVIVSHGVPIDREPSRALRRLASEMA